MTAKLSREEFENKIIELAEQGITAEKIGLILKKELKIKSKRLFGKRISKFLKEKNIYINPDIKNLKESVEKLKKHRSKHKKDKSCKRTLAIKEAKLRKLVNRES